MIFPLKKLTFTPNDGCIPDGPLTPEISDMRMTHRSTSIYEGQVDCIPTSRIHGELMHRWVLDDRQRPLIDMAGFGAYIDIHFGRHDRALLAALGERWWPATSKFHFQFEEMTITLEDTYRILGLPIQGEALVDPHGDDYSALMQRLLGVPSPVSNSRLNIRWLYETFRQLPADATDAQIIYHTRAYLLALCGSTLFLDETGNKVHPRYLKFFEDLSHTGEYAWGAAVLADLYSSLSCFAIGKCNGIFGCITLLQVWSYEHLPVGRPLFYTTYFHPRAKAWCTIKEYQSDAHHSLSYYRSEFDNLTAH